MDDRSASEVEEPAETHQTPWQDRRLWQIRPVRDLFWITLTVAVAVGVIWLGYVLRSIFTPVLIALALAYLFQPTIRYGEHQTRLSRPAVIGLIMAALVLVGVGTAAWLVPRFVGQLVDLASHLPGYVTALAERYEVDLGGLPDELRDWASQLEADPAGALVSSLGAIFAGTTRVFGAFGHAMGAGIYVGMSLLLILVYFFFFAWQFDRLAQALVDYIPASRRERSLSLLRKMDRTVATFFRARLTIALIMGAMLSIGWWWAGVPYWFILGMGSGLLSLVPFASIVGWPLAVLLMWLHTIDAGASGSAEGAEQLSLAVDFWQVVFWPSLVYLLVQGIESWVLTPVIQGQSMDMSIVTVLLVVFVGGALGGLYGLLLCIPLAACAKILLREVVLPPVRQWAAAN